MDIKQRVADAALGGAVAGIRQEYPNHRVEVVDSVGLRRVVRISHPTAQNEGPRYFQIRVSEMQ